MKSFLALVSLTAAFAIFGPASGVTARAADPDFGPNVLVLDPSMTNTQAKINKIFYKQGGNQFGADRYAFLFKPGKYNLTVQMGFYMQVLGWGNRPTTWLSTAACGRWCAGWAEMPLAISGGPWRTSR